MCHNEVVSCDVRPVSAGIDAAPKHAAKCRLQLAEYAVLECISYEQLIQILPRLSQQVGS
jgi:hypothetical protein